MSADGGKAPQLLGRLWKDHLHRYGGDLLALAPVLAGVAAIGVGYTFIFRETIGRLQAADTSVITWAPLAFLAATLARAGAIWAQAILSQGLGHKVLRDLQGAMFSKLVRADFARSHRENSGQSVSRLTNDINVIAEGLVRSMQVVVRDSLTLIGTLLSMLWLDWVVALMVIAVFLFAGPPLSAIARRARKQTESAQLLMGHLTSLLSESFSSPRFVKTYGLEAHEESRANAAFEERRRVNMKIVYNRARVEPLMEVLGGVALAVVLTVAGVRIVGGEMEVKDLLAMIAAVGIASPSARSLGTFNTLFNEGIAALGRVYTLLDEKEQVTDRPGAKPLATREGRVAFESVAFAYGDDNAISEVSFAVAPGETVALVGASGAGKSTVFNLIPRLYDATAGRVTVDGVDVRDLTLASLRGAVALVSQDTTLFDDTIRANIAFGRPGATFDQIETAARAAAAHDFILAQPQGYETRVGERGSALSGGERQRIALARAFLRDAPILLLDEATSALDAQSEARVQDALTRLSEGRTTLVIAHRLASVRAADRILVMDAGRIVESGSHDALMAKGGAYAALARLQLQA
ncbi:MAG: ATP-binding cassette, subfamily B, bacterial MsbA [Alphaproteobacteria bacterium]|nr:MAG: ATP-binding cassette, subfamily B, bacterial MsbA [Alphaproteobacteria bacterium]